jgi:hypothetical protein
MLIYLFDTEVRIHFEFVPEGTPANQTFYAEVLERLINAVRGKQVELWGDHSSFLRHDKAPAHSSLRV